MELAKPICTAVMRSWHYSVAETLTYVTDITTRFVRSDFCFLKRGITLEEKIFALVFILGLRVATASVQFAFGLIVYDPTNYTNPVLRYNQLVE
jgi:hypothetical protein